MFKIVETFSGIGAQAKAFERLRQENNIDFEITNTCEWDVNSIIAYCNIHKGKVNLDNYKSISDEEIDDFLVEKTLSMDGKSPINGSTYNRWSSDFKRLVYAAIKDTSNFVSITDLKGSDISNDIDLFTYSFPCQDLSMCGYWHGNLSGIAREANNRSGMLWEVERILKEMFDLGKRLPKFLLMENVTNILSSVHKEDFNDWKKTLSSLGYYNKIYKLNAKNFGSPQKRERAYMISVLVNNNLKDIMRLESYFMNNDLEDKDYIRNIKCTHTDLKSILKVDYSINKYKCEADESQPNDTPSRQKIYNDNALLYDGEMYLEDTVSTVTTKQDRNPNSGLIFYDNGKIGKCKWRYLTPRECFMLMGFDECDYDKVIENNPMYTKSRKLITNAKLIKMAGNSICVNVLEAIFEQILDINKLLFQCEINEE